MSVFIWLNLVAIGALGLLAVVSPRMFSLVAGRRVIREDMHQIVSLLDKDFNVDHHRPLPHCRLLGATVLAAVALIALILIISTGYASGR
jgi:hypothetical protein